MGPKENTNEECQEVLDTRETIDPTELTKISADKIFRNINVIAPAKFTRTEKLVNLIKESTNIVIDEKENFIAL